MEKILILYTILSFYVFVSCDPSSCAEMNIQNNLKSDITLIVSNKYDTSMLFDTFRIKSGELKNISNRCGFGTSSPIMSGSYCKFIFSNNKSKIDTQFANYNFDSINIYNYNKYEIIRKAKRNSIGKYTITNLDSLESI